ncbi:superoxide dismutase [Halobacillus amylolyticus]|uniref:superoxide dismutase n=1 Tax=Halobacillus amylolyticus TaxID=2932259 RepID=A0ABY4HGY4_9BACI|nr:superoxide dismutase [Halobacillus amylolyticus]UOR13647.1 superoxide dismutase [Halobacillus amylolyticus]
MNTQSPEQEWLHRFINWSQNYEQYLDSLRSRSDMSPDEGNQIEKWVNEFNQLRQTAESYSERSSQNEGASNHSPDISSIYTKANHLHENFLEFLQEKSVDSSDQPEEHRKENQAVPIGEHTLPPLPYNYDALEPYISEKIMRLHHDEHHKGYVEGLNKAEKEMKKARRTGDYSLIRHWEVEAAFNGAGHYLHTIFWDNMSPYGGGKPSGPLEQEIKHTFGGFEKFKEHFSNAAEKVQSVGWAMLVWSPRSWRTEILQAEKHQNLSQQDMIPLLVLDVWEHAYYLQYTNNRSDYIDAWWNVVNWDNVNRRYQEAKKVKWQPF